MGVRSQRPQADKWRVQPLTPLMEGPDPEAQGGGAKKEWTSWELIRTTWARMQKGGRASSSNFLLVPFQSGSSSTSSSKRMDVLRLILGVLGCPLAPVLWPSDHAARHFSIKDSPIESLSARYIIQQYLAAAGCLNQQQCRKSMYVAGSVKMVFCDTESSGRLGKTVRRSTSGGKGKCRESGCFVLWQMSPGMWSVELVVAGYKLVAGCDGKLVWRHLPWLGMSAAARGPQRPLRRIIQGLDPKSTASMFTKAQCLGEKRIGDEDCFVLKVSADRAPGAADTSDVGHAEVIRHVLYGYFSQRSGLLIYMEDSHLSRVQAPAGSDAIYWETTIGSSIEDYREVDGVLIAHQGRSVANVFRFGGEISAHQSRTRMEEVWRIDDVVFNVPGLSVDSFIPPTEILGTASGK